MLWGVPLAPQKKKETQAAFGKLKVDPLLATLVGGEAIICDPVAIIMFSILNNRSCARSPPLRCATHDSGK